MEIIYHDLKKRNFSVLTNKNFLIIFASIMILLGFKCVPTTTQVSRAATNSAGNKQIWLSDSEMSTRWSMANTFSNLCSGRHGERVIQRLVIPNSIGLTPHYYNHTKELLLIILVYYLYIYIYTYIYLVSYCI